jgi:hypothetical protein
MPDFYSFAVVFLLCSCAGGVGYLAATVAIWSVKRLHYRLECDIADLQQSVLVEIKKRAGQESAKSKRADTELITAIQNGQPKANPNQPWWNQYVHPDLKGS